MWQVQFHPYLRADRRSCSRAFTLAELVVSMAIMSVLAVAISSAVVVSLRAVETPNSASTRVRTAADVSARLSSELTSAVTVQNKSAQSVTFSVPDRDSDGNSEEIRYSWSGVAGDPLYRGMNAGADCVVLPSVTTFALAYDMIPIGLQVTGRGSLLAEHKSQSDLVNFRIGSTQWLGQAFVASLPAGATGWRPTRVVVCGRALGASNGDLTVQLRSALSDGRPGITVYTQTNLALTDLRTTVGFFNVDLSYSGSLSPSARVAIVFKSATSDACELRYHNKGVPPGDNVLTSTLNAGSSWSIRAGQGLLFEVYGTVLGVSNESPATEMRLGTVRWELQAGADSSTRVYGGVQTINLPE